MRNWLKEWVRPASIIGWSGNKLSAGQNLKVMGNIEYQSKWHILIYVQLMILPAQDLMPFF